MTDVDNKKIFARNLQRYMNKYDISRNKLSEDTGFPYSTISDWLNGNRYPRINRIEELSNYFNIEKSELIEDPIDLDDIPGIMTIKKLLRIPILGEISCGSPILAEENYIGYFPTDPDIFKADFSLYAKGDSMVDANIHEGDIVFFRKTPDVENGRIAAVIIDGEAMLKRVRKLDNALILEPCNNKYSPMLVDGSTTIEVRILGEMIAVLSKRDS